MSERKWTKAQLSAIEFSKKNLILSAAAGSGKTATLTERIIRLLKNPESGADLSRMLIVTFTIAAAGELKTRIADALTAALAKDPMNAALARQLSSLEGAHISTIDSFFKSELKPHFAALGLPPDFSVLDEAEAQILRTAAVRETVQAFFDGKGGIAPEEFFSLTDCISTARNEADLTEALLSIFADLLAYDISADKLRKNADSLEGEADDFFKTEYSAPLKAKLYSMGEHYKSRFDHFSSVLSFDEYTEKYSPEADRLSRICEELTALTDKTFGEALAFFSSIEFPNLSSIKRGYTSEDYNLFKDIRNDFKKKISQVKSDFFSESASSVSDAMKRTGAHIRTLSYVFEYFINEYGAQKREKGSVDFSDLGVFARKIFVSPDGTPTSAAIETGKKYDYIFIDEYQDTNPVQDDIFAAVSENAGRFMVGDVKQSIYGFRGSCPELFTSYRNKYEADESLGSAIFMSENFRSDKCVIDFSNTVSRYIFSPGSTPFEECDELVCSKPGGDSENRCEVILVEKEIEGEENPPTEPECVAARISQLIAGEKLSSGEPIQPRDIAILLRSGTNADSYVQALSDLGISATNSASEEFFDYGEVLLILCLLNTADNPLRDVYLAGAMKSPLFGFTLNDLVNIRKSTSLPLWYSLCEYCESGSDAELKDRCTSFKNTVDRWRACAAELYCDEMLRLIVTDTNIRAYSSEGPRTNADVIRSLKILTDHARSVASRGGTLHDLIAHLNSVIERKDKMPTASDKNAVSILNVHKSKGLEYPVCFICESSKRFNNRDTAEKLLIDRYGKAAMKLYDTQGLVRCDNPLRRSVALQMTMDAIEEEARILYVAMTRARERLIISCKVKNAEEKLSAATVRSEFALDTYEVTSKRNYGDWIIDSLRRGGDGSFFVYKKGADIKAVKAGKAAEATKKSSELQNFFEKSLDFSYSKEYLWNIPAKLSVSVLKPDILGSDAEKAYIDSPDLISMDEKPMLPAFLSPKKEADSAEKGTATHIFMQFCSFDALYKKGAAAELSRLIDSEFISKSDADLVRLDEIELFSKSDLFERIRNARSVMRERRFNTRLPAANFTRDPELSKALAMDKTAITVQGVVDCIFIDSEGNAVLVDYKTDRLTKEELENEEMAKAKLLSRHKRQLLIYKSVCEQMIGRPFSEVLIYSLPLGKAIEVR